MQQFFDDEKNKHVITRKETYSTNKVILNDQVNAFNYFKCELRLRKWFDKADNLWLNNDLS